MLIYNSSDYIIIKCKLLYLNLFRLKIFEYQFYFILVVFSLDSVLKTIIIKNKLCSFLLYPKLFYPVITQRTDTMFILEVMRKHISAIKVRLYIYIQVGFTGTLIFFQKNKYISLSLTLYFEDLELQNVNQLHLTMWCCFFLKIFVSY